MLDSIESNQFQVNDNKRSMKAEYSLKKLPDSTTNQES